LPGGTSARRARGIERAQSYAAPNRSPVTTCRRRGHSPATIPSRDHDHAGCNLRAPGGTFECCGVLSPREKQMIGGSVTWPLLGLSFAVALAAGCGEDARPAP